MLYRFFLVILLGFTISLFVLFNCSNKTVTRPITDQVIFEPSQIILSNASPEDESLLVSTIISSSEDFRKLAMESE